MPYFSVIIPVYNVRHYLEECLESVREAADRCAGVAVELICVDDGSTDGSGEILDGFATRCRRSGFDVVVVHQKNGGEGCARNAGIARATGDWMLFVDSDDVVRETIFSDLFVAIKQVPDADLISYAKTAFDERIEWQEPIGTDAVLDLSKEIPDLTVQRSVCEFAYRTSRFANLRFGGRRHGSDLIYVGQVLASASKCHWLAKREYAYRYRAGSAMHSEVSASDMMGIVAFTVEMFRTLESSGKSVGMAFGAERGRGWLETQPKLLLSHRLTPEWETAWMAWLNSLREMESFSCFSRRQKLVARLVTRLRSRLAVRLLCLLPFWLKRKGLLPR